MQKDAHYCLVKVLAEKSGFAAEDAQVIAYASQYTDDAVEHQPLKIRKLPQDLHFNERVKKDSFDPICTAHRGIQYTTGLLKDVQRKVYIPFHFLPAEKYGGKGPYRYAVVPDGGLVRELTARALEAVSGAEGEARLAALIRLGVALHTYADSWSHQRFSGRRSGRDNDIERICLLQDGEYEPLPFFDQLKLNLVPDVGHAEALNFPDQSHLKWKYEHDASGIEHPRDNTVLFLEAAQTLYETLCRACGKLGNWKGLVDKLKACLSLPTDSIKAKFRKYCDLFPEIPFDYHEDDWRSQALRGETFEWGSFDPDDYRKQSYVFNGDRKWFYFHKAAYEQRAFALNSMRQDLL